MTTHTQINEQSILELIKTNFEEVTIINQLNRHIVYSSGVMVFSTDDRNYFHTYLMGMLVGKTSK